MSIDSKADSDDDVLSSAELNSIQISVELEEPATGIMLRKPGEIALLQFVEDGFVISCPVPIRVSHQVQIRLIALTSGFESASESLTFEATAKIKASAKQKNETYRLTIRLVQYDKETWAAFKGRINTRQEAIQRLFEANRE